MISTRRRFLRQAASLAALSLTGARALAGVAEPWDPSSFTSRQPVVGDGGPRPGTPLTIGFGVSKETDGQKDWTYHLTSLDLEPLLPVRYSIAMPHYVHGVVPHPDASNIVVTFQKRGPGSSVVDLAAGRVLQQLAPRPGQQFYGHGVFSADGKFLMSTETVVSGDYRGLVGVRDADDYGWLGEFPSYGSAPHDLLLFDGGRTLAITNGGGPISSGTRPCVTYVDVANQRLMERFYLDDEQMNAGHLALSLDNDLVVISSFRDGLEKQPNVKGGVSLKAAGGPLETLQEPADVIAGMLGETLSVAIDDSRHSFATTTPQGDMLAFWDLKTGKLKRAERVPQPKGIVLTPDLRHYVVSYTYRGRALMGFWSAETLRRIPELDLLDTYISGSHLFNHRV